jgi:hypothetical protein
MYSAADKPKLIFFQNKYADGLPEFLLTHKQEHVSCLSVFFDVTVIHDDCDYEEICDTFQPDLALFESGVNLLTCRRPKITNVRACRTVPKLGLLNADAWCETRSGSLSEMEHWDVDAIFSIAATAPEHMPAIANRLFVWPNFIDPAVYRDYGEAKLIPVLLSGATAAQYPWRRRVYKLISEHYPSLSCPHQGYLSRSSAGQVLHGERYARIINASQVAPVCGTVAREVVRKHFEIPGCNACLITEKTRFLEGAGFVDMTNCVFADEHDVLDRLDFLFTHPEQLRKITAAGHRLVHSRHTMRHRDQIWQWFNLYKGLKPGQKIVQSSPFMPIVIEPAAHAAAPAAPSVGTHLQLLREGDERLWAGQIQAAESKYRRCLSYMHRLSEARFKIAVCKLYSGDAVAANAAFFDLIQYCIAEYKAADPDPVEWAYYTTSLLCMGKVRDATICATEFPWLHHPELDRIRRVALALSGKDTGTQTAAEALVRQRWSIHNLLQRTEVEWREQLCNMLKACGQAALVQRVIEGDQTAESAGKTMDISYADAAMVPVSGDHSDETGISSLVNRTRSLLRTGYLDRQFLRYKVRRKLRRIQAQAGSVAQQIVQRFSTAAGLPIRSADLVRVIRDLSRDMDIRTALIVGGNMVQDAANAILEGKAGSESGVRVYCISDLPTQTDASDEPITSEGRVERYELSLTATAEVFAGNLAKVIQEIKQLNMIDLFDAVVIDWRDAKYKLTTSHVLRQELHCARFIVLGNLQSEGNREIYAEMLREPNHVLLDHDAGCDRYAVLKKKHTNNQPPGAAPVISAMYIE